MAVRTTGWKAAASASPLWACRTTPPAKSWPPSSSPQKQLSPISAYCASCCAATVCRSLFTAITVASSFATTTTGRSTNNSLENDSPPSSAAPWNNLLSPSSLPTVHRPKAASNACGASCRIVCAVNFAWLALRISTPPTPCCASSLPTTIDASPGKHVNPQPPGGKLPTVSTASAASCTNAPSATTTSCNGQDAASKSLNRPPALASPPPKYRSTRPSTAASRSTTARLACSAPTCQGGDTFMLPLG